MDHVHMLQLQNNELQDRIQTYQKLNEVHDLIEQLPVAFDYETEQNNRTMILSLLSNYLNNNFDYY